MVNYQNGLIYRICCKDINIKEQYVGSTCDFTKRKYSHKNSCNNPNRKEYNYKVYKHIRDNGGFDNFELIMIEKYPSDNEMELKKRERFWKEELKATLNGNVPSRTPEEYRVENKDNKSKYDKELLLNRTEQEKEEKKEYSKNYYQNNKDKWIINTEKTRQPVECECGRIVKGQMARHKRSPIHLKLMSNKIIDK